MIPYTITKNTITVVANGRSVAVPEKAPNFKVLRAALLEERWDDALGSLTAASAITKWAKGRFKLDGDRILFDGEPVDYSLSRRIHEMAANGEDPSALFRFWERLQNNPSKRSVEQVWRFLENQNIPLTADGHFLAYKKVRHDWKDVHSGSIENRVGKVIEMPRNKISDDPNHACHVGLHVGALGYAQSFGGSDGIIVICKVDPADVVCVPFDASSQKMRVSRYEVVGVHGEKPMPSTTIEDGDLPQRTAPSGRRPKWLQRLDALDDAGLMGETMDTLRRYASQGLSIVGAYRLSGGKFALVQAIAKARR